MTNLGVGKDVQFRARAQYLGHKLDILYFCYRKMNVLQKIKNSVAMYV